MKKILFILITAAFSMSMTSQKTHTLTVEVSGIKSNEGKIVVALYNTKDHFLSEEETYKWKKVDAEKGSAFVVFEDVPVGEYTFAVYHDEDNNNKLDKTLGVPNEGFAFSNNAKPSFGPPSYEDAVFKITDKTFQMVELIFVL